MIDTIYVEEDVSSHPRTQAICSRFSSALRIPIERYGEVFNRRNQSFRLQKQRPALILARKHAPFVLDAPAAYGIGGDRNSYFSHMMNCLYDCRYCFLQGMYRSAHFVLFVNYEDFQQAIEERLLGESQDHYFFSGYDCDSLAMEAVTGFAASFLPFFATKPRAWLELRTKASQARVLLDRDPLPRCVVAFSFTPAPLSRALEHKVPSLERRLTVARELQERGWAVGLRFDPLIYDRGFPAFYSELFGQVFEQLEGGKLHSVSLGPFRLPRDYYKNVHRLYPEEKLFASPLEENQGMVSYQHELEEALRSYCTGALREHVDPDILFPCLPF